MRVVDASACERLEQFRRCFRRNADAGVLDGEQQFIVRARFAALAQMDRHRAAFGELDRVAGQVGENLTQACRIAAHRQSNRRLDRDTELQALRLGALLHQPAHRLERVAQVDADAFQFELVGFDLRVVEDVVDDAQQLI